MSSEWETVSFAEAPFSIIDGDRGSNYPKQHEFSTDGFCLFLNAGNVTANGFDFSDCAFISKDKDSLLRKGKLVREDLVLTTRGTVGNVAYYSQGVPFPEIRINSGMVIFRPVASRILPRYLYLFLRSNLFKAQVLSLRSGSAQPQLPIRDMHRIEMPLPSLVVQKEIVGILGALDDRITLLRETNATLEAIAQALFKSWFVDFDPVRAKIEGREPEGMDETTAALFPDSFEESELGLVPMGWASVKFADFITRLPVGKKYDQKTASPNGATPILDQGKSGVVGYHDDEPGVVATAEDPVIVFANHTCYMRLIAFPFSAIQNVLPFRGKGVNTLWAYFATKDRVKFSEYKGHWPDFAIEKAILPNTELTDAFARIVAPLMNRVRQNEIQSETLADLRDTLLPRLISGQLRLSEAEAVI